jgi:hypothetical protein
MKDQETCFGKSRSNHVKKVKILKILCKEEVVLRKLGLQNRNFFIKNNKK